MLGARPLTVLVAMLAAATGGCSWLLGISEDPVVGELGIDAAVDPDAQDGAATDPPDVEEAAAEDTSVE